MSVLHNVVHGAQDGTGRTRWLGVARRPCKACSAHTSPIFYCFPQIVRLATHTYGVRFWLQLANAESLWGPRVSVETLPQSSGIAPDPSART